MKKLNKEQAEAVWKLCRQHAYANINNIIDCHEKAIKDPLYLMPDRAPYSFETLKELELSLGIFSVVRVPYRLTFRRKWWEIWK